MTDFSPPIPYLTILPFMQHFTDIQIYSIALLLFFSLLSFWKLFRWIGRDVKQRYLCKHRRLKRLKRLSWSEFEHLCAVLFEKEGWHVFETTTQGADGGVDIHMKKRMKRAIVQCKKYEDGKVTVKVVREMYGLMHEYEVDEVYIVTTSEFTKECYRFVEDKPMVLLNGDALVARIRKRC